MIPKLDSGSFTEREILQQPSLWPDSVQRVQDSPVLSLLKDRELLFCGAGTSAYAAAAIALGTPEARSIPSTDLLLISREELLRKFPDFAQQGAVVSVARSGDSPESIGVVTRLQKMFPSARHLAIACNADGALVKLPGVHALILDPRTNDRSLAMTSSFSNLTIAGMALFHAVLLSQHLPAIVKTTHAVIDQLQLEARRLAARKFARVVVLTGADLFPLAAEASLKILEMTGGATIAIPETFLGLRHGPMSFLRADSLVIGILSSDAHKRRYEVDLLRELGHKKLGHLLAVGESEALSEVCSAIVPAAAPQLPDFLRTPFEAVFPQLLAYHLSLAFGLDPDNPSPNGVITRVVERFRLHEESF